MTLIKLGTDCYGSTAPLKSCVLWSSILPWVCCRELNVCNEDLAVVVNRVNFVFHRLFVLHGLKISMHLGF
jgi:hypothetical protein